MSLVCLSGRVVGGESAPELVMSFFAARFFDAERHHRRLDKVRNLERERGGR